MKWSYTDGMNMPPEIEAGYERLKVLCRDDQDLVVDEPITGGVWKVYLQDAAPLVANPQTFWEMQTYIKHLARTGQLDMQRMAGQPDGSRMSDQQFLDEYLIG